jgi:glycosyltransferase involved in cell wall biosynthesis
MAKNGESFPASSCDVYSSRVRILQVSTYDQGGGAEAVAWQLFAQYRRRGHRSVLAVGEKRTSDSDVYPVSRGSSHDRVEGWSGRLSQHLAPYEGRVRGAWRLRRWLESYAAYPPNWWQTQLGREVFNFPDTWRLLDLIEQRPDVLHCHNLHGGWLPRAGYFDLRALPALSRQVPTVLTLHDTWLLSGHCAYTLGCDRWKTGCGNCPDLAIYPSLSRDGTAFNWKRKHDIFKGSRLRIATPSRWLLRQVEQSMLSSAVVEARVIPNGVDLNVFSPACKETARNLLNLPRRDMVLLFVAHAAKSNRFKDYPTIEEAAFKVAAKCRDQRVTLIILGERHESIPFENGEIRFMPFQPSREKTAQFYQAADVYLHAARSDTFPNTVLEALACGLPVIATAVDGIPEQVDDGRTGFLVPAGDAESMAGRVVQLLSNHALRSTMGECAAQIAGHKFGLERQVDAYLEWYEQFVPSRNEEEARAHAC